MTLAHFYPKIYLKHVSNNKYDFSTPLHHTKLYDLQKKNIKTKQQKNINQEELCSSINQFVSLLGETSSSIYVSHKRQEFVSFCKNWGILNNWSDSHLQRSMWVRVITGSIPKMIRNNQNIWYIWNILCSDDDFCIIRFIVCEKSIKHEARIKPIKSEAKH